MRPPRKTGGPSGGSNGGDNRRPPSSTGGNRRPTTSQRRSPGGADITSGFNPNAGGRPVRSATRPPRDENDAPQRPRAAPRPAQRRPDPGPDSITTSRREAERFEPNAASAGAKPAGNRRSHIPGGRLPKIPNSAPRELSRPRPAGGRPPRRSEPAAFSDLPATAPTGRRGRGEARVAQREAARTNTNVPVEPQRIAKLLARAGIGSRRDIERMIAEGKVALGGQVLTTPAMVVSSLDGITVEGNTVAALEPSRLFRFHKPAGFLTTARDPGGRPTIMDILPPGLPRVVPVGRLDMNTEGLLLLTTDGALKRALELPANAVPRRYRVRAYGEISQPVVESLIDGLTIDGMRYGPIDAEIERRTGRNLWLTMTLTEGKNREIRRVLEFLGLQVSRLIRVGYGGIELADLEPRDADEVPDGVVASLRKQLARGN